jgi:hypothetical protein
VPNDGKRDLPDVSLFAGDGLNANTYVVCETDIYGGCAGNLFSLVLIGGTSASSPGFAGIMAMVDQKTQSRQGNANYVFYPLAAGPGASCDSSGAVTSSCIFYDVTKGTIAMPCATGSSPSCVTNTTGDKYGVPSGYSATAGYDLATGLGSVNVTSLVNGWTNARFRPTTTTLALNGGGPVSVAHGTPLPVTINVTPQTGPGLRSGFFVGERRARRYEFHAERRIGFFFDCRPSRRHLHGIRSLCRRWYFCGKRFYAWSASDS